MKNWPVSILFEVASSMFGRAFLALIALGIGVCIAGSIISGGIFIPKEIIAIIGLVAIASIAYPISAAFFAGELTLGVLFIRSEGRFWILGCIAALAAFHTFYILKILE